MSKQVISDEELIKNVKDYLAVNPNALRGELRNKLNTSVQRLVKLSEAGHFKIPNSVSKSVAATIGRKKHKKLQGWYISKPTVKGSQQNARH